MAETPSGTAASSWLWNSTLGLLDNNLATEENVVGTSEEIALLQQSMTSMAREVALEMQVIRARCALAEEQCATLEEANAMLAVDHQRTMKLLIEKHEREQGREAHPSSEFDELQRCRFELEQRTRELLIATDEIEALKKGADGHCRRAEWFEHHLSLSTSKLGVTVDAMKKSEARATQAELEQSKLEALNGSCKMQLIMLQRSKQDDDLVKKQLVERVHILEGRLKDTTRELDELHQVRQIAACLSADERNKRRVSRAQSMGFARNASLSNVNKAP